MNVESESQLLPLVKMFLADEIEAPEFEMRYTREWNRCRDNGQLNAEVLAARRAFDAIFTACDVYCSDPELRGEHDIDERQLKQEVTALSAEMLRGQT